jgi:hypothetical protein
MDNFIEKFKTKSNAELIKIIKDPRGYKTEAVQAAKDILESRNLNDEDIEYAKEELANQLGGNEIEKLESYANNFEIKTKEQLEKFRLEFLSKKGKLNDVLSFIEPINPIKSNISKAERIIRTITILIGLILIYILIYICGEISEEIGNNIFTDNMDIRHEIILILSALANIPILLLVIIIIAVFLILFHRRKRIGWIFFIILFTCTTCLSILNSSLALVIINGAFLWFLCQQKVREVYSTSKESMYLAVGFITVLTFYFKDVFN